ncbi:MAG: efflux RND transporter periplasmic adaptor subunit [Proteobacteria bacterium]|nr:efflux RND transporter periplasmic adaptor subunit [Pseudomonadota bacterium]
MLRRHAFLVGALALLLLMAAAGVWKLFLAPDQAEAQGGPAAGASGGSARPAGGGGAGGGRAATVRVALPEPQTFEDRLEALGQAKARRSVTITSDTTELITRVLFTSGQRVGQGQTLVELKAEEQGADVARAQAALGQAQRDLQRYVQLDQRGFAPRAEVENRRAAVAEARATLRAVQARAQDRLIRAPFGGTIGLSDAAPGQLVNPGAAIATLDDLSSIHVDFPVPERYLGGLRAGLPVEAASDAFPDQILRGTISRIDTRVDPATRAVTARAEFANPGERIKPGMLLRVGVVQGARQALAVPESAVLFEGDEAFVYAVAPGGGARGGGQGGAGGQAGSRGAGGGARLVAQRRPVKTGARQSGRVEIVSGLRAGERIVADGLNRVNPNQPVRIAGAGGGGSGASAGAGSGGSRGAVR